MTLKLDRGGMPRALLALLVMAGIIALAAMPNPTIAQDKPKPATKDEKKPAAKDEKKPAAKDEKKPAAKDEKKPAAKAALRMKRSPRPRMRRSPPPNLPRLLPQLRRRIPTIRPSSRRGSRPWRRKSPG